MNKPLETYPDQLSSCDWNLIKKRMPGIRGLAEIMLARCSASEAAELIYLLHDYVLANKTEFTEQVFEFFTQPKAQIDTAANLFILNKEEVCQPSNLQGNEHPALHFYFLYDCLRHAASFAGKARAISYLSVPKGTIPTLSLDNFWDAGETHKVYKYIRAKEAVVIADELYYHTELAQGQPVQSSGEIALIRKESGDITDVYVNEYSGHYHIKGSAVQFCSEVIHPYIKEHPMPTRDPINVYLTSSPLSQHVIR